MIHFIFLHYLVKYEERGLLSSMTDRRLAQGTQLLILHSGLNSNPKNLNPVLCSAVEPAQQGSTLWAALSKPAGNSITPTCSSCWILGLRTLHSLIYIFVYVFVVSPAPRLVSFITQNSTSMPDSNQPCLPLPHSPAAQTQTSSSSASLSLDLPVHV